LLLAACGEQPAPTADGARSFTIAVIPDTQNYLDYTNQQAEGFPFDASEMFITQMQDIASREDIAFVASVGDVWQHQSLAIDPVHAARNIDAIANPFFAADLAPSEKVHSYEIPRAIEGYRILAQADIPFGVAPGNHDYDAMWSVAGFPPNLAKPRQELTMTPEDIGLLHIGGLDNFRSVFGSQAEFFKDKPWYVSSFRGGANSAQVFTAAGYHFLHITLEMAADDAALAWAAGVIAEHLNYPTIITTHDYLNTQGQRAANPLVDLKRVDPDFHNTAEAIWQKFVSQHDQIFLVLSGHHHGQSQRVDNNQHGNKVYQLLADYQSRGQAGIDAGDPGDVRRGRPWGLGDGWYRLMQFDFSTATPTLRVQTWSSHYRSYSGELDSYATWYQEHEQPTLSALEFLAADDFVLQLEDFRARFDHQD